MSDLIGPFVEFGFMRRALVATLALSLGSAPIGCILVLRRMSLVGDAMAHAVLPGAAAGFHVGLGIAHQEAVLRVRAQAADRGEHHVRGRLVGEAVGALHVIEVLNQSEALKHLARGGRALGGRRRFAAGKRRQPFLHAGVDTR